jgi:hypothetical protein
MALRWTRNKLLAHAGGVRAMADQVYEGEPWINFHPKSLIS